MGVVRMDLAELGQGGQNLSCSGAILPNEMIQYRSTYTRRTGSEQPAWRACGSAWELGIEEQVHFTEGSRQAIHVVALQECAAKRVP